MMKNIFKTIVPEDAIIIEALHKREMRIEGIINRFRIAFMGVLCIFDTLLFILTGKFFTIDMLYDFMGYALPICGYLIIQLIIRSGKYRPWIKYYTVFADFTGCTIFTIIYLYNPIANYPISVREFLMCMSIILLFFNTLSLYRGYKEIIIFSSILSLIANIILFIAGGYFFMMGVLTTILMINFSLFYIWAGNKIIQNVITNSQLNMAMEEIKEANAEIIQQNEEISTQRDEIEGKSKLLELKNLEITQSIQYALRIQQAVMPGKAGLKELIPESFIYYRPKDIVSGDFYWYGHKEINTNKYIVIVAADCTGHGVPGAFMSLVGTEKLIDAIEQSNNFEEILPLLNHGMKTALHQSDSDKSTRDGMDIALCLFDKNSKILHYSGANRPLYFIKKGEITVQEIKPTKSPIGGITSEEQEFQVHTLQFEKGDKFYIFSDGFVDQFGGITNKKLMTKGFREMLSKVCTNPLNNQKELLDKMFIEWKGMNEQLDDVLVIGVEI